jgi:hypothetical protein
VKRFPIIGRLCFCTRANPVGVGYARSNTLYVGRRRWSSYSGPWTRVESSPRLAPRPSLWLAASSSLVVTFISTSKKEKEAAFVDSLFLFSQSLCRQLRRSQFGRYRR